MPSKPLHRPSILDIARDAGVSPATVSRAFNRPQLLKPDTLQRIERVARKSRFRPNRLGSGLRSGSTRTIGMALPTLRNPVFAECFEGAEAWAHDNGYSIMVTTTGYDVTREAAAVHSLIDHQVEGVLLAVANAARSATLRELAEDGLPYVLVYNESPSHPCVSVDNMAAAGDMLCWLAGQGHTRIALVTGPLAASDRARRRLQGARACARKLGLPPPAHLPMPSHTAADVGILRQALRERPAPTALFCSNDLLAVSVIAQLRALGLHVPQALSVCGFDGMHLAALMVPPLTTVEQPSRDIGATACAQLLARLRGESAVSLRLPHRLMAGGTVAAAAPSP
ncbi:LacI family transcriptional regulator [Bordetella sp. H567]|uniref:LacI family DNA-binding transcriptional regulator n=1 Tax=Bordetella sp. H567 TaxID=1697043 RepID=UPI00081CD670|nr:substrate-binding domain-containing protein [Bordetella sp. H567]AOB29526.1 LacI family transcriptional regulator [Bordetella sp. H567]